MKITFKRKSNARRTQTLSYQVKPDFWDENKTPPGWSHGWSGDGCTVVDIEQLLNLNSDFRVEIQAEEGELETWLERYAAERPKEAVVLLAKMTQIAAIKLTDALNKLPL